MKYKVGDKVLIKSFNQIKREAEHVEPNGDLHFKNIVFITYSMKKYCGKLATIKGGDELTKEYKIMDSPENYWWSENWFIPPTKASKILYMSENEKRTKDN